MENSQRYEGRVVHLNGRTRIEFYHIDSRITSRAMFKGETEMGDAEKALIVTAAKRLNGHDTRVKVCEYKGTGMRSGGTVYNAFEVVLLWP